MYIIHILNRIFFISLNIYILKLYNISCYISFI